MTKQPDDQLTELTEEDGSDSEPSVDNFDQAELKDMLVAALDLEEGEPDPFVKESPQKEEVKQPVVRNKVTKKKTSDLKLELKQQKKQIKQPILEDQRPALSNIDMPVQQL